MSERAHGSRSHREAWLRDLEEIIARETVVDPDVERDRDAIARGGLMEFVRRAWKVVEPSKALIENWHMQAMCECLEAVSKRDIRRLVINIPPSTSKSIIVSVLWLAWHWTWQPGHWWLSGSYSGPAVLRDADRMRSLITSPWYRERWPNVQIPTGRAQSDAVSIFTTTAGGRCRSLTIPGGAWTSEHCDTMDIDDPTSPKLADATSGRNLDAVLEFFHTTALTRFRDHNDNAIVCTAQRLHQRDLPAEMIRLGAEVLCFPMRFEANHPHRSPRDPRTVDGELLDPVRFTPAIVAEMERNLGPYAAAAQLQQRPVPAGGGVFQESWIKYWTELPTGGTWSLSVDCAFKDGAGNSWVVVQVWLHVGPNFYLVDQWREHASFTRTVEMVEAAARAYPLAFEKLIEDKANGSAVIDTLEKKLPGLKAINPDGGKETRAHATTPLVAGGNVLVPHPTNARYADGRRGAPWVEEDFLPEVLAFPNAATDDQVDTMTQYLNHAASSGIQWLEDMMANA